MFGGSENRALGPRDATALEVCPTMFDPNQLSLFAQEAKGSAEKIGATLAAEKKTHPLIKALAVAMAAKQEMVDGVVAIAATTNDPFVEWVAAQAVEAMTNGGWPKKVRPDRPISPELIKRTYKAAKKTHTEAAKILLWTTTLRGLVHLAGE